MKELDKTDRKILKLLQQNARIAMTELAEKVGLSTTPVTERVRRLEREGIISGYHAHLDRRRIGYGVLGFVQLNLHEHTSSICAAFEREVLALPQVLACHNLSGRHDYQLEVVAPDLEYFAEFVRSRIRSLPGVREISTSFSLKEIKRTIALPLDH